MQPGGLSKIDSRYAICDGAPSVEMPEIEMVKVWGTPPHTKRFMNEIPK